MCKVEWVFCPVCENKTRIKIRHDTVLENFPLFCPKCKQETLINVRCTTTKNVSHDMLKQENGVIDMKTRFTITPIS